MTYIAGLLDQIGLGGERVRMANLSSAMGAQFAETIQDMVDTVKTLGPNPLCSEPVDNEQPDN